MSSAPAVTVVIPSVSGTGAILECLAALRAICIRAMSPKPVDRYQDVLSLVGDIRRYRAGLAVDAHPETALERTMRFVRTYRTAIVLILAYLAMRVIVAVTAGR